MIKNLEQLFQEYISECEFGRKSRPETLRGYIQTFTVFRKLMPELSLDQITSSTVVKFFRILQERKRVVGKGIVKTGVKKSTIATYWKTQTN